MDPPKDPNEQPESSSQQGAGESGSRREVDLWCAISESPSLANAPAPDIDANLWQVEAAASGGAEELAEVVAAGAGGVVVPWCTHDEHDHFPSSSAGVPRFPADSPSLCSMRDVDLGAPSYRFGMLPNQAVLGRQESLDLLAESWAQLVPDELVERFSQDELRHFQDGLEQILSDPAELLPMPPPAGTGALDTPETLTNEESAETVSSISDTLDDSGVATSSCDSQAASAVPSPGSHKRKGPVLDPGVGAAGASPQTQQQQHQQSMDASQKKLKGLVAEPSMQRPSLPCTTRPRYAIQTRTEVDVIDDGYRWRKYGQKPVKNSAHPRNYYRCTTANCPVRKRVERSTEDPSHVLTTYDGTHNHPETASTGGTHARELNPPGNIASSIADQDAAMSVLAPMTNPQQQPMPLGAVPPRLPPSNYIAPNIISHLLAMGQVPPDQATRWSHPPAVQAPGTILQRSIDLLTAHQMFRLQYGTQYPLLANMLSLMRSFSRGRPPMINPRLDPRFASLLAAQSTVYNSMQLGGQIHQDPNLGSGVGNPQQQQVQQGIINSPLTSPSTTADASLGTTSSNVGLSVGPSNLGHTITMAQRLLWQQGLMREGFGSEAGHSSQQPASLDNPGVATAEEEEGPENHPQDVEDPPM